MSERPDGPRPTLHVDEADRLHAAHSVLGPADVGPAVLSGDCRPLQHAAPVLFGHPLCGRGRDIPEDSEPRVPGTSCPECSTQAWGPGRCSVKTEETGGPFSSAEADPGEAQATSEGVAEEPAFPRFHVRTEFGEWARVGLWEPVNVHLLN